MSLKSSTRHFRTHIGKQVIVRKKNGQTVRGRFSAKSESKTGACVIDTPDGPITVKFGEIANFTACYERGGTIGVEAKPNPSSCVVQEEQQHEDNSKRSPAAAAAAPPPPPPEVFDAQRFIDGFSGLDMARMTRFVEGVNARIVNPGGAWRGDVCKPDAYSFELGENRSGLYVFSGNVLLALLGLGIGFRLVKYGAAIGKYRLELPSGRDCLTTLTISGSAVDKMASWGLVSVIDGSVNPGGEAWSSYVSPMCADPMAFAQELALAMADIPVVTLGPAAAAETPAASDSSRSFDCVDCGEEVPIIPHTKRKQYERCHSCNSSKLMREKWAEFRGEQKSFNCVDCGALQKVNGHSKQFERCAKCHRKARSKALYAAAAKKKPNHPIVENIKEKASYDCVDCGRLVTYVKGDTRRSQFERCSPCRRNQASKEFIRSKRELTKNQKAMPTSPSANTNGQPKPAASTGSIKPLERAVIEFAKAQAELSEATARFEAAKKALKQATRAL